MQAPTSLGEDVLTLLTFCLTKCFTSLSPNLDQLSHFPLWETLFPIQHNVAAICQRCVMCSPLHYSCILLSGWLNASFLHCLRLIWNSNIASLLSLNNIDFHLLSRGTGDIFRAGLSCFFCFFFLQYMCIWGCSGLQSDAAGKSGNHYQMPAKPDGDFSF